MISPATNRQILAGLLIYVFGGLAGFGLLDLLGRLIGWALAT